MNAVYNMGSHVQFVASTEEAVIYWPIFIHILGHIPSFLILLYCLITVRFINDPCDFMLYLMSMSLVLVAIDCSVKCKRIGLTINGSYMIIREINKCHVKYYLNLGCDKRERGRRVV